jgi:hypothetical protein
LAPNGCLAEVPLSMGCADEPSIVTAVGTDFGRIWVFGSRLCRWIFQDISSLPMFWHDLPLVLQHSGSLVAPVSSKPERSVNMSLQGHLHEVLPTFFVWLCFSMPWLSSSDSVQTSGHGGMGTSGSQELDKKRIAWTVRFEHKVSAWPIFQGLWLLNLLTFIESYWIMTERFPATFFYISKLWSELRWRLVSSS